MIHPPGPEWLAWLEASAAATAMRQWLWLYPAVEIVHIVGFVILAGAAALFDLRLLGLARHLAVTGLARHHLRWARLALILIVPSGLLMFAAHAAEMAANPAFRLKLLLIALAGVNAAAFHRGIYRSVPGWDRDAPSPLAAKLAGILSLSLWTGVIACGRLLAYL